EAGGRLGALGGARCAGRTDRRVVQGRQADSMVRRGGGPQAGAPRPVHYCSSRGHHRANDMYCETPGLAASTPSPVPMSTVPSPPNAAELSVLRQVPDGSTGGGMASVPQVAPSLETRTMGTLVWQENPASCHEGSPCRTAYARPPRTEETRVLGKGES